MAVTRGNIFNVLFALCGRTTFCSCYLCRSWMAGGSCFTKEKKITQFFFLFYSRLPFSHPFFVLSLLPMEDFHAHVHKEIYERIINDIQAFCVVNANCFAFNCLIQKQVEKHGWAWTQRASTSKLIWCIWFLEHHPVELLHSRNGVMNEKI